MQIAGPPAPETLRRDQFERRQRIVLATVRAVGRSSNFEDIKITDIARESDVALGTLYRYFASKEHLLAAAFLEWQSALKVKLNRVPLTGVTEADRLREVFRQAIRAFQVQPQFFRVMNMLQNTTDAYAAAICDSLGSGFQSGVEAALGGPLDETQTAVFHTVEAVLDGCLRSWVMKRMTINEAYDRIDTAISLIYDFHADRALTAS